MTKVIGVRFRTAGKIYFFSPGKLEIKTGDKVIVETARGVEFGSVVTGPKEVEDDKITQPLKSVIRLATEDDKKKEEKNKEKEKEAFKICLDKIHKHGLEMKLIDTGANSDKYVWQQSGLPQIPIPPRIFVSSRTPICLNSILVRNTLARSFTSSRKSIRPSAVK